MDYDNTTGTFTAPITEDYQLNASVYLTGLASGHTSVITIATSNRSYVKTYNYSGTNQSVSLSTIADMDAGDTATVTVQVSGGSKVVGVLGNANPLTYFNGGLVGK